jgi:hypothetical protein
MVTEAAEKKHAILWKIVGSRIRRGCGFSLPQRKLLARVKAGKVEYDSREHWPFHKSKEGTGDDETVEGFNETLQSYDNPPDSENCWHENVGSDLAEKEIGWELGEDIWTTLW